ncbi:MAG TPA: tetratricopeptide repeat protein [Candidatus Acidoferrales bacterium]|nr:tetratricopeptide repeat protein [Candidatus Acidoferrales bacterium]
MRRFELSVALLFVFALFSVSSHAQSVPQSSTLDQARSEVSAGHFDRAAQLFEAVLVSSPDNPDALAGLVDAQVAAGRWRDALPALKHLVQLQPNNAERTFQLGQMVSWQGGQRKAALDLLKRAVEFDPANVEHQEYYAEVLSWDESGRPQALSILRGLLTAHPNDVNSLLAYAAILSWNRATRPQALENYKKVLARDPKNPRALAGQAQLMAWGGHSSQAFDSYEQVLNRDPDNVAALRGEGQILNWRGLYSSAKTLLEQAHGLAPDDSAIMLELARAEYGLGQYAQARTSLEQVNGPDTPDVQDLRHDIDHALGAYIEFGYAMRRDGKRLDSDTAEAIVSTPLGASNRLSLLYEPSLFRTSPRNFNSNYYSLMLDSHPLENLTTHAEVGGRTYPGVPSNMEGAFDASFNVRPSFRLTTGFQRAADLESLVSTLGAATSGIFVGQVETNLGSIAGSYSNSQHHFDVSLTYTDGAYTGQNLASNRRWSVDGNFGKSVRSDHPYIRVAYVFTYLSFDHDAEFEPGSGAPARVTGGYFSPTRFLLNYGQINFSAQLGRHAKWDASGFAGAQKAETTFTSFSNAQFASTFSTHLTWNVTRRSDLRLRYDYLNVFNAFHRHLFLVSWRQYF